MSPARNVKYSGRYRSKQQFSPQYLWSTQPTIHPDNNTTSIAKMTSILTAMKTKGIMAYSSQFVKTSEMNFKKRRVGRKSMPASRTLSTSALQSLGDTDDTEDEGFPHRRFSSVSTSSQGSGEYLCKQAMSVESLTSSYSSLGERSVKTSSPLDDINLTQTLSTSLRAILDPDFDYDHDPDMRKTVEDIVSPKVVVQSKKESLMALDPSVLIALPGCGPDQTRIYSAEKYTPTDLCDLRVFLTSPEPMTEVADPSTDLTLLRVGSTPVDDKSDDLLVRRRWDIPNQQEEEEGQVQAQPQTAVPYHLLSESSESEDCCLHRSNSPLSHNSSSSSSWTFRSRSSSLSSNRDSSDYLADISSEETNSRYVTVWPPTHKLNLHLENDSTSFVISPRIPGVPYYGDPPSILTEGEGSDSRGLEAFFKNRSIVHRLGPHGLEQVYDMEPCPEGCGFEYPVPAKQDVIPTLKTSPTSDPLITKTVRHTNIS